MRSAATDRNDLTYIYEEEEPSQLDIVGLIDDDGGDDQIEAAHETPPLSEKQTPTGSDEVDGRYTNQSKSCIILNLSQARGKVLML